MQLICQIYFYLRSNRTLWLLICAAEHHCTAHKHLIFGGRLLLWRGRCDTSFPEWVGSNFPSDFAL